MFLVATVPILVFEDRVIIYMELSISENGSDDDELPVSHEDMELEEAIDASIGLCGTDEETLCEMRKKELRVPQLVLKDDVLPYRSTVVEWMNQIGDSVFNLMPLTVHMAVFFFDSFVSKQVVHPSRLQLVATSCILIAAKHQEVDDKVPSVQDLNYCCNNMYTTQIICKMELVVLNTLGWECMVVTPRHFLETYLGRGASVVHPEHETIANGQISFDRLTIVQRYIRKYSSFFGDLCLQVPDINSYLPSVVATASLAAARKQLQLLPLWPQHLRDITGYQENEFRACLDHIWSVYQTCFPDFNNNGAG